MCIRDRLRGGSLVQGFVDRWVSTDVHLYEKAVRWEGRPDAGPWTASHAWAQRYLRAVAATTWLGPALAGRVRDAAASIDDLCTPVGPGLRLDAPPGRDRRRIEHALADIVPGLAPVEPRVLT